MTDISVKSDGWKFKLRSCNLIIDDNKVLVERCQKSSNMCFPGGHVELGETTKEGLKRETLEEIKTEIEIKNLFCIIENIYPNNQEISYFYKTKPKNKLSKEDFKTDEIDKGVFKTHEFTWIDIDKLEENGVKPLIVSKELSKNKNQENLILFTDERD